MTGALQVAVIGSGPSGFYAAEALMRACEACRVDMFERLPTPHGLVRYGVAPDHQKLKQVASVFDLVAKDPRFRLLAGVEVGCHVSVDELLARYHAVVVATGSPIGRELGVPNESLPQVFTSAKFVGWYNGHPDHTRLDPDLGGSTAVIVGNGNVALDVCRLLVRPFDDLRRSDIPEPVMAVFRRRGIRHVHVVGRSPVGATKFTFKEFRQLAEQAGLRFDVPQAAAWAESDWAHAATDDAARVAGWLKEHAGHGGPADAEGPRVSFWFNAAPKGFCERNGALSGVLLSPTCSHVDAPAQLPCDIAVTCIGYLPQRVAGLPQGLPGPLLHRGGQVVGHDGEVVPDLFVAGWAKRGPTGIIGTNRADSYETVQTLLAQLSSLLAKHLPSDPVDALFPERALQPLSYAQWLQIDAWEKQRGAALGKPREKALSSDDIAAALAQVAKAA